MSVVGQAVGATRCLRVKGDAGSTGQRGYECNPRDQEQAAGDKRVAVGRLTPAMAREALDDLGLGVRVGLRVVVLRRQPLLQLGVFAAGFGVRGAAGGERPGGTGGVAGEVGQREGEGGPAALVRDVRRGVG